MGISAYKEVTEWSGCEVAPNHIYLFDGKSNALAYAPWGKSEIKIFNNPMKIDTRYRKFVKVKHDALESYAKSIVITKEKKSDFPNWKVKSDSGKEYIVEKIGDKYHCNCIGYSYRGKCKHSDKIKKENV